MKEEYEVADDVVEEVDIIQFLMDEIVNTEDGPDRKAKIDLLTALLKTGDKQKELALASETEDAKQKAENKRTFWQIVGGLGTAALTFLGGLVLENRRGNYNRALAQDMMTFEQGGNSFTTDAKSIFNKQIRN